MRILTYKRFALGFAMLALFASAASAQDQSADNPNQSQTPIPAYHSPLAGAADNGQSDETPSDLTPDTHSLSGVQALTIGTPVSRTYWQPSFNYSGSADSNPITAQPQGGGSSWTGWNTFTGEIDVHRIAGDNNLILSYVAGGTLAVGGAGESGVVQNLNAVDTITFHRWTLTLIEQLSLLPPSGFGIGGIGTGIPGGITPPVINPGLPPTQTLLVSSGETLSNSSDGEATVNLTGRTSLTFVGGYSLLHFFNDDTLDFDSFNARAGYNYQWTRKDTLALGYTYNTYRYSNVNQSIDSQSAQVSYGRRMTGRLAFQASAGPQFSSFKQPIPAGGTTPNSGTQLYWTANVGLQYQLKHASISGSYYHGVGGGSGVLAGAVTDNASGTLSRQLTRTLSGSITVGFSRNRGVALITVPPTVAGQTYDYWTAGGGLSRPWGRTVSLNLSYQMQYQTSGVSFCVGATCGMSYFRNVISVGASWRDRPLLF